MINVTEQRKSNVEVRTKEGKTVRKVFVCEEKYRNTYDYFNKGAVR